MLQKAEAGGERKTWLSDRRICRDTLSEKGEIQICLSFAGDTLPHKEEIKALGYRWTAVDASQMAYMHKPDMGWVKVVPYEHLE